MHAPHPGMHTPLGMHPLGMHAPSPILRDTVNERALRILLECILVLCNFVSSCFTSGIIYLQVMMTDVSDDAWQYFAVCVPVVVIGAPLGSVIGSHFHRLVLAALIYLLDTVALITAFIIVPQSPILACVSVGIILIGFGFFFLLTILGNKVLVSIPEDQKSSDQISYINHKESPGTNAVKFQDSK